MVRGWISANPCPSNLRSVRAYVPASRGWQVSSVNRLNDAIEETKLPSHAFNEMSLHLTFRYLSEGLINPHFLFPRLQTLSPCKLSPRLAYKLFMRLWLRILSRPCA